MQILQRIVRDELPAFQDLMDAVSTHCATAISLVKSAEILEVYSDVDLVVLKVLPGNKIYLYAYENWQEVERNLNQVLKKAGSTVRIFVERPIYSMPEATIYPHTKNAKRKVYDITKNEAIVYAFEEISFYLIEYALAEKAIVMIAKLKDNQRYRMQWTVPEFAKLLEPMEHEVQSEVHHVADGETTTT